MREKTYHVYLDSHERQIVIHSLESVAALRWLRLLRTIWWRA